MGEEDLIRRLQQGVPAAWAEFDRMYAKYLFAIIWRITGDAERSEDVLLEVREQVWHNIHDFKWRADGCLKAWVVLIAVNRAKNALARQHGARELPVAAETLERLAGAQDNAEELSPIDYEVAYPAEFKVLCDCLEQLPGRYSEFIRLRSTLGDPARIANITGDAPHVVRVKLNQAARALLRCLSNHPQLPSDTSLPGATELLRKLKEMAFTDHIDQIRVGPNDEQL
jgi:RNA polymerase sigma factor (sigma-70 family)